MHFGLLNLFRAFRKIPPNYIVAIVLATEGLQLYATRVKMFTCTINRNQTTQEIISPSFLGESEDPKKGSAESAVAEKKLPRISNLNEIAAGKQFSNEN